MLTSPAATRDAVIRLQAAGVLTPELDCEALARHAELTGTSFAELVDRRAAREPLQHLLGTARFRDLDLLVGPGVFVPQPETGAVVDWTVAAMAGVDRPVVVDLCTGSGTVALALAHELRSPTVHAVERDPGALAWAARNVAARAAAGDPAVQLLLGDAGDALPELDGQCDLVASNPPYVATTEAHVPDPEVVGHDPAIALWAGVDGLDLVRLVERAAARLLRPDGLVVVEHSDRQGVSAPAVFTASGDWLDVQDHPDQLGRDRFVTARRAGR